ncbi:MAG: chromosome segregation protein SMC [Candidatus Brocadiaceae bacterium]|nr:chromosome segregation protein SMC [Candidatus Brocadiaceae bacterium]
MKLKKLELFGFKSFAEKTEIIFEDGVNAVVGPNGCGKSNVVDAIKWVLGEQSVKSLRGNEMVDVIFNGTETRPSLGYAEVSLTIQNNKGILPLEYSEVCITRRLYTSGESEYLINKQASRLKDIRGLFMDTGFGSGAYSVIEQGNVEALLRSDARERRLLFEEAAGISKFKSQKKSALMKLEQVEQNLLRVGDIVEELQKQLRSIKLQASKARKFQDYTERLKKIRVGFSLKTYRDLKNKKNTVSEQLDQTEIQNKKILTQVEELEAQIGEIEETIVLLEQQTVQLQTERVRLEAQISKNYDKITYDTERIKELEFQQEKYTVQQTSLESKVLETSNKALETKELLQILDQEILKFADDQQTKETIHEQIRLECDLLHQDSEERKAEVITLLQKESNFQNEIGRLTTEKDSLKSRKMRLQNRQEEITLFMETLMSEHQERMEQKHALSEEFTSIEQKSSTTRTRLQELNTTIQSLNEQINLQKQRRSSKNSRHEVLMDYETREEGVGLGAKTILEESRKDCSELHGIRGMIADLIRVDLSYALAIETVLGDRAQGIIADTTENAMKALSFLQNNQKGNVIFFPLDRKPGNKNIPEHILQMPEVVGIAGKLVSGTEEVRIVIDGFLSNTIVVRDLNAALALADYDCTFRYVTLNGELVEPEGSIQGGKRQGQVGIISRKSELIKIGEELTQIQQTLEKLERDKSFLLEKREGFEAEIAQLSKRTEQINILKYSKESEITQIEQKREEYFTEKKINEDEIEEIDIEVRKTCERENVLQTELMSISQRHNQLRQLIEESALLTKEKEQFLRGVQDEITTLKVDLAQKREKKDSLIDILYQLNTELRNAQEQITHIINEGQNCLRKKQEAAEEIRQLELSINDLGIKKTTLEEKTNTLAAERENTEQKASELKTCFEEKRTEHSLIDQQVQELKLKENEHKIRLSTLEERVREEYKLELSELDSSTGETCLDKEDFQFQTAETSDSEADFWSAVSKEIEELQGKIERLGNVNLEAIKEQDELEIRENFLLNQKEDLETSHNSLQNLIKKINHTSRESFEKAFQDIRINFQAMFRKLFGGGKADLILEENVDILEAGIEILAQPPNKELRSIMLLSGGEKVMITVALLFAVFQSKPSPFCILDEVDAALDENNIRRFTHVIKEFTTDTQFLMITHNKATMGLADVIYGVTMEEPGVSKKISLKFEEIERKVA